MVTVRARNYYYRVSAKIKSSIMITIKEIRKELSELMATNESDHTNSKLIRIKKRIQFLKTCEHYLESNPTKEFIQQEYTRLEKIIKSISEKFEMWKQRNPQ